MSALKSETPLITLSTETILQFLQLPTADDTQTAFAQNRIFISETTAKKWRHLASVDAIQNVRSMTEDRVVSSRGCCCSTDDHIP